MPDDSQLAIYARLLRLEPVSMPVPQPVPPGAGQASGQVLGQIPAPAARLHRRGLVSLVVLVVLPICLVSGYFWLLAANRYESEARFVLRMPGRSMAGPGAKITGALQSAGITRADDDGYVVKDYLESRDAMAWLERHAGLKAALSAAPRDPVWGFPGLLTSDTQEGLYKHYKYMMSVSFDSTTGVSTLSMQGFTAGDAERLTTSLLDAAEALINRLNDRARHDAMTLAEGEVDRMRQRTLAAQSALTAFRERERLVDPSQSTLAVMETIAKLSLEASHVSVEMNELRQSSPKAPQIAPLAIRRAALEGQIAAERKQLAGDAQALAPRIAEYERLMLEREFAEKSLISAMSAMEMARVDALRQQVYLERVAVPGRPDTPAYPWRIVWTLATLAAGYLAWRTWRIVAADTARHGDI